MSWILVAEVAGFPKLEFWVCKLGEVGRCYEMCRRELKSGSSLKSKQRVQAKLWVVGFFVLQPSVAHHHHQPQRQGYLRIAALKPTLLINAADLKLESAAQKGDGAAVEAGPGYIA
ncbi:mediator of RNA polymerase II transcription subunit 12-like [Pyrus ussuriensis x Pyrus communis]|uniref:Mediator of RNA polymerase II transcription subunit 12-like n=1 Tax=Pyrus ussuriensis x Pyrus communis TaxID=2448454 RepID=A0A5N5H3G3_9ROSA|nr:mediator of RNA polymerase II transcription subunit 12-like [Pyrus ussuriensis x Pyrus communis]